MSLKKSLSIVVALCFFTAGCSKQASSISPTYVSPLTYSNYNCSQIRQELIRVNNRVLEVTGKQNDAASKDTAALAIGLVLFWPALFFMIGGDKKEELGRLKGEYEALQKAAIEKECDIAKELEEVKKQKEESKKKQDKKKIEPEEDPKEDN